MASLFSKPSASQLFIGVSDDDRLAVVGARCGAFYQAIGQQTIFTVTCVADVSLSLDSTYFTFYVGADGYRPFYINDEGVDPGEIGITSIGIVIAENATDVEVATATMTAINDADIGVTVTRDGATLTFTENAIGYSADVEDNDTGFTINVVQEGVNPGNSFILSAADATDAESWERINSSAFVDAANTFTAQQILNAGATAPNQGTTWGNIGSTEVVTKGAVVSAMTQTYRAAKVAIDTRTSTNMIADSELTISGISAGTYEVVAQGRWTVTGSAGTPGLKLWLDGTNISSTVMQNEILSTNSGGWTFTVRSAAGQGHSATVSPGATAAMWRVTGTITFSSTGTATMYFAQATGTADTVNILAGGYLKLVKIS